MINGQKPFLGTWRQNTEGWSGLWFVTVLAGHRVYDGRSYQNQEQHFESLSRTSRETTKSWKLRKINQTTRKGDKAGEMARRAKALSAKPWKPEFQLRSRHRGGRRKNCSNKSSSDLYTCAMTYYTHAMTYYTNTMTHTSFSLSYIMIGTVTHKNTTDFRKIATEG